MSLEAPPSGRIMQMGMYPSGLQCAFISFICRTFVSGTNPSYLSKSTERKATPGDR